MYKQRGLVYMPNACTHPAVRCWKQSCVAVSDSGSLQIFLFCKMTKQITIGIPNIGEKWRWGAWAQLKGNTSDLFQI